MPQSSSHLIPAALWLRVSTADQDHDNQVPASERFAGQHGYDITRTFAVDDSAWKDDKTPEYRAALQSALDAAHRGEFKVLIVWALDRITRLGAEDALRLVRKFREAGCMIVSVQESQLNGSAEVQDVLVAFAGWMAQQESFRRSKRIKAGVARRKAEGNGQKTRKRSGYVRAWEDGGKRRRAAGSVAS